MWSSMFICLIHRLPSVKYALVLINVFIYWSPLQISLLDLLYTYLYKCTLRKPRFDENLAHNCCLSRFLFINLNYLCKSNDHWIFPRYSNSLDCWSVDQLLLIQQCVRCSWSGSFLLFLRSAFLFEIFRKLSDL